MTPSFHPGTNPANGRSVERHMTERFVEAERHIDLPPER